jgi:hypothetical protein
MRDACACNAVLRAYPPCRRFAHATNIAQLGRHNPEFHDRKWNFNEDRFSRNLSAGTAGDTHEAISCT